MQLPWVSRRRLEQLDELLNVARVDRLVLQTRIDRLKQQLRITQDRLLAEIESGRAARSAAVLNSEAALNAELDRADGVIARADKALNIMRAATEKSLEAEALRDVRRAAPKRARRKR